MLTCNNVFGDNDDDADDADADADDDGDDDDDDDDDEDDGDDDDDDDDDLLCGQREQSTLNRYNLVTIILFVNTINNQQTSCFP